MPLRDILRKIMDHRADDILKQHQSELPEINREFGVVKELIDTALEEEELPSEAEKIQYFQRLLNQYGAEFKNPVAVDIIQASCKEAGIAVTVKLAP